MDSRQFPSRQKPHYYGHTNYNSLPTTRLPPLQQQRPFYRERYCNSEKYPPRPVSMIAISNSLGYATLRKGLNIYKKIGISNNQHSNRTPPPTYYQTILNKERSQKSYSVFDNMISSSQSLADIHLATLVPNIPNHYQHLERAYNPVIIAAAKKHNMPINSHYPSSSTYFPVSSPSTSTITNLPIETSFVESQKYTYRRNSLAEAYDNAIQLPELSLYEKTPSSLNLSTTVSFFIKVFNDMVKLM